MFEKISVLVPTRHRPERLRTMIESFVCTSFGRAELVFRVDDDDPETLEALEGHRVIVGPRLGYSGLPAYFNELYKASTGDVLMCGNDDIVFKTQGWDVLILAEANKYPDGIFDFGVLTHNAPNFPLATVSRKAVDAVGCFFDPRFFWGDIFWRDVASQFGRAIPLPHIEIDHDWVGFNPDRVFLAGENHRRNVDTSQHALVVREAVEKLRGLM